MRTRFLLLTAAASATLILAACGGGGGGGGNAAAVSTTISGSAVKGPVSGATVTVKNAATGAVLGTTTTSATGTYTLSVAFSGDVVVEVSGGTYTDEATNTPNTPLSTPMRAVITANGGSVTGVVTPLTTIAYTNAFGTTGTPTASAFNTAANTVATQFNLNGVNLATTVPVVTGSKNDYGRLLAGFSQYMQANHVTLQTLTNTRFQELAQGSSFSAAFTTAYNTANPGSSVTFSFDGNAFNIGGTGAGGGSGTCGVHVQGTVTSGGFTVPLNLDYCIQGIAEGSCTSGNSTLNQALDGQSGVSGAANLAYSYSATCAAGATTIRLN